MDPRQVRPAPSALRLHPPPRYPRAIGAIALALLVSMSGCGRYYWSKPGGSAEQFDRDNRECAREASPAHSAALGVVDGTRYRACLTARGWGRDKQLEPVPPGWYRGIE